MKRREKMMTIATVVIVGIGLALTFMPEDFSLGGGEGADEGSLEAVRSAFRQNLDVISRAKEINSGFAAIDDKMRERVGKLDHEKSFQNELAALLKNQLNVPTPKMSKTTSVYIPNVDDYYFVELVFDASGTREAMTQLLIDLEHRGLLIMKCRLARDRDNASLNVTIARLFKHDADSLKLRDRRAKKSS